tara:strand:- start:1673 stop:2683 length:1011 start_codon:yes stop_codon:yes gene_type:complete
MTDKLKQIDKRRKSQEEQKIIKLMGRTGDLYGTNLGHWRLTPNLDNFKGKVVALGDKQSKGAGAILIENDEFYGKDGADFAARVSIVAGLHGHTLDETQLIERVEPANDAAGLYISQRSITQAPWDLVSPIGKHSVDGDYGASKKQHGTGKGMWYKAQSDVTAYADTIQLVARTGGVNIYGGLRGGSLGNGLPNESFLGVNLIAGNRIDDYDISKTLNDSENYNVPSYSLQPLVKGHSLQRYLNRVSRELGSQASENFSKEMRNLITEVGDIGALFGGFFSAGAGAIKAGLLIGKVPGIINSLGKAASTMYNSTVAEVNSSAIFSESYLSQHNKTN